MDTHQTPYKDESEKEIMKNEEKSKKKKNIEENDIPLHTIPVISSLALNSLPPNIKAIPLGVSASSLIEQQSSNINNTVIDKEAQPSPINTSPPLINSSSAKPENAINIPMEFLDQIVNGEISIRALLSNIDTTGNAESARSNTDNLVAIETKMGTIPIIPVKGKGGLQLIPIQQGQEKVREVQEHNSIFTSQPPSTTTMLVPDASNESNHFPLIHPTFPMVSPSPHSASSSSTISSIHLNERLISSKSLSPAG